MRVWLAGIVAIVLLAGAAMVAQSSAAPAPNQGPSQGNVTQARVLSAQDRANNWLVYGGNFESQHFSPLNAISDKTIGKLGLAWSANVDSPMGLALEPTVVVGWFYTGLRLNVVEAFA